MSAPVGKKPLHAFLDEETANDFRPLCRKKGVSQSGLVEAMARSVLNAEDGTEDIPVSQLWDAAREVDSDRRARERS